MPRSVVTRASAKASGSKSKAKASGSKSKAKASGSKATDNKTVQANMKVIKSIKSEINSTIASKSTKSAKQPSAKSKSEPKTQVINTKTLIRTEHNEMKRKVIKITNADFVKNHYKLDNMAYIEYYPNFVTKKQQENILLELTDSNTLDFNDNNIKNSQVPWQHGHYSMYGKDIPTPRLLYAMRDKDEDVTNAYTVTDSMEWTDEVKKLRDRITKKTGKYCRYAQMNLYRNGDDYIGFHTDSEVEAGDIIASISLGAERTFRFISSDFKHNSKPLLEMTLEPGSLLIMSEYAAKHNWKHELPKDKGVDEIRINITFRPN
jgi:alkylated DNA repair dioxygenase AlkB